MVVISNEVERSPCMVNGIVHIPLDECLSRAVHGDHAWKTAPFVFVSDYHLCK
jgi:hypothetical protein